MTEQRTIIHPRLGEVTLARTSRARRVTLSVRPSGAVRLSYPWRFAQARALEFLESKVAWVEAARERMAEARTEITEAHRVQTDAIQGEAAGERLEYSLLFTHAQDTLMTVNSEINLTKQLIGVFESYEARISALEARLA